MLVIAAIAIGIVGTRKCDMQMRELQIDRRNLVNWFVLASPLLMSVSLALMVAKLLPPRPKFQELFRQAGFVAVWMTSLTATLNAIKMISINLNKLSDFESAASLFNFAFFWPAGSESGGSVLVAWITLALAGCWRSEPRWIDRVGRALGVIYISGYLANQFSWLLWLP